MRISAWIICSMFVVGAAACNHEKVAPATPSPAPSAPPVNAAPAAPRNVTANQKMSHTLAISGDIVQLCGIKATRSGSVPKFTFDKADLSDDDRNVLQQLANCMRTGPLQGKNVELLGRADPRGTQEYNLALGSRRALSVSDYLQGLGIDKVFLYQTTRGALDATGTDPVGWADDRRVDITLKQG
jgi:outer membrane protein OmpA-like peptidoglycan-associated protein